MKITKEQFMAGLRARAKANNRFNLPARKNKQRELKPLDLIDEPVAAELEEIENG